MGVVSILPAGLGPANTIRDESQPSWVGQASDQATEVDRAVPAHHHDRTVHKQDTPPVEVDSVMSHNHDDVPNNLPGQPVPDQPLPVSQCPSSKLQEVMLNVEDSEDSAGDIAFQTASDFSVGFVFGLSFLNIGAGFHIMGHLADGDHM